jgi:hypothetical protein
MVNQVIQEITKNQRPYYHQQGNTIKGINNQYWLIFKHRDSDNLVTNLASNLASFLGLVERQSTYKLFRNEGTFREIDNLKKRRFNLPQESPEYIPLFNLVINEGKIRLLMDWQGFTNKRDIKTLKELKKSQSHPIV